MENTEVVTNEIIDIADHIKEADPVEVTRVVSKRSSGAFATGAIASGVAITAIYLVGKYIAKPLWLRHKAKSRKPEMIHTDGVEVEPDNDEQSEDGES